MAEEFTTYEQAVEWLQTELVKQSKLHKGSSGFEESKQLFEALGNPQDKYPTIHVAGTSGKGTVAWMTSDLLVSEGRRVGTIMSPHVYDFRERFLVGCDLVATSIVLDAIAELKKSIDQLKSDGIYVSYFQAVVALGYLVFSKQDVDTVVVEVGIGGKLDATNHVSRDKVAVITTVGLDHTELLGETLEQIAAQKAGIITSSSSVVALRQSDEINEQIEQKDSTGFTWVEEGSDFLETDARVAYEAVSLLLGHRPNRETQDVIDDFSLPGRFEIRRGKDRMVILDGAHNSQKIDALVAKIRNEYSKKKFVVLLAMAGNRENKEVLELLSEVAEEFVLTKYDALSDLPTKAAKDFTSEDLSWLKVPHRVINDHAKAIEYTKDKDLLVTGSFYLVGEIGPRLP